MKISVTPKNGTDVELFNPANPGQVIIASSTNRLPIDKQAIYRKQAFQTTTLLGANGTYTQSANVDASNYKRITGFYSVDQSGTMYLEHSVDGVYWHRLDSHKLVVSTSPAVTTKNGFSYDVLAPYVRCVWVNGATAQGTSFVLTCYLSVE